MAKKPNRRNSPVKAERDLSDSRAANIRAHEQDEASIRSGVRLYATKRELMDRARQLGVKGRSRMNLAELAEAVEREDMADSERTSTMSSTARQEMRSVAQHEVRLAVKEMQSAIESTAKQQIRSVTEQLRSDVRLVVQQAVDLAEQRLRSEVRSAMQHETPSNVQAAEGEESITQGAAQPTVRPGRADRHKRPWRVARTVVTAVAIPAIVALLAPYLASDYYTSRIADKVIRRGTSPISTRVLFDRDNGVQGLTWALPGRLGTLSQDEQVLMQEAGDSADQFNDWIRKEGGVDVDVTFMNLVVSGQRQGGVTITGMKATFEGPRRQPLRGTLFYAKPESERKNTRIGFNLDEQNPIAHELSPDKNLADPHYLGSDYFEHNNVPLRPDESHVFSIVAMTAKYYCVWYIDMQVDADGRTQNVRVGVTQDEDRGRQKEPFKTTAQLKPRSGTAKPFSPYKELYVLDNTDPIGFVSRDPATYPK